MRRQPWGLYAIAAAILVVGLVAVGVPARTLLFAALVLACPLMMLTMHGGAAHGGHAAMRDKRDTEPTDTTQPTAPTRSGRVPNGGGSR
jgi:hypothetical protein